MDMSSSQMSGFSASGQQQDKEKYIKKNIVPIRRGPSAIFGDPISEQNDYMDLPSPATSQRNSRVTAEKEEQEEGFRQEQEQIQKEKKQEGQGGVNNENEEQGMANEQESLDRSIIVIEQAKQILPNPIKQESPRQDALQHNRANENPPPRQTLQDQSNQQMRQDIRFNQQIPYHPDQSQRPNQSNHSQQNNSQSQQLQPHQPIFQIRQFAEQRQSPIIQQHFNDSNLNKLKLKHKKYHFIEQASDQSKLILQVLEKNTHHLQTIQEHINNQSVILNQFKEETSRKLEENVKLALREKMNEINRENSKELKDIKNLCINLQQLFLQNSKRIDNIQKKLDTLLANSP